MFEVLVWLETWNILQIGYDSLNFDMLACIWANKSVRNIKFFISYLWTISPYTSHSDKFESWRVPGFFIKL